MDVGCEPRGARRRGGVGADGRAGAFSGDFAQSTDIVPDEGDHTISLAIVFTHPVEGGPTMNMGEPIQFGVLADGKKTDLKSSLKVKPFDGKNAYTANYKVDKPADYVFYLEPAPYWEPAENHYIQHFAKVVVDFGSGDGWDKLVGAADGDRAVDPALRLVDGQPVPRPRAEERQTAAVRRHRGRMDQ